VLLKSDSVPSRSDVGALDNPTGDGKLSPI
jgi:hypothetical protein